MTTKQVLAETIEEGDMIEVSTNNFLQVQDIRENGRMDGAWFEFPDRSSMFYKYDQQVTILLTF